jgi:hypothetical protein
MAIKFFGLPMLTLLCFAIAAAAEKPDDDLDAMLAMMAGTYRTNPADLVGEEMPELLDRHVRVDAPAIGAYVVYWQLNSGPDEKVYRQQVLVFMRAESGDEIVQQAWSLREPAKFIDAFDDPAVFASLKTTDLQPSLPDGCDQLWRKTEDGWYGRISPDTCRVWSERRKMWRRIGAEAKVEADAYWQGERGFDDDGKQLFGTQPGDMYRLQRIEPTGRL